MNVPNTHDIFRPVIIAHRGLHQAHPENSLGAFAAAWGAGMEWCECDVRYSRDGVAMVMHDETVDRTTTGSGAVHELESRQMRRMKLVDAAGRVTAGGVPTLDEVLQIMPTGCGLMIEFKEVVTRAQLLEVRRGGGSCPVLVQSFHDENMALFEEIFGAMRFALLIESAEGLARAVGGECRMLHVNHRLVDHAVALQIRGANKSLGLWTVNEAAELRRVMVEGAERIITDEPVLAKKIWRELARTDEAGGDDGE